MANLTDPARELFELAEKVNIGSGEHGAAHLAKIFEVDQWSADFMRIITSILDRADQVAALIDGASTFDDDMKAAARDDLAGFKQAFTGHSLSQSWHDATGGVGILNTRAPRIKYLSAEVRRKVQYPKLTEEETAELIGLIDRYLQC